MEQRDVNNWRPEDDGKGSVFYGKSFGGIRWNPYQFRRFIGNQLEQRLAWMLKCQKLGKFGEQRADPVEFVATAHATSIFSCRVRGALRCSQECRFFLNRITRREAGQRPMPDWEEFKKYVLQESSNYEVDPSEVYEALASVDGFPELFGYSNESFMYDSLIVSLVMYKFEQKYAAECDKIRRLAQVGEKIYEERKWFLEEKDQMLAYVKAGAFYHARMKLTQKYGEGLAPEVLARTDTKILQMDRERLNGYLQSLGERVVKELEARQGRYTPTSFSSSLEPMSSF